MTQTKGTHFIRHLMATYLKPFKKGIIGAWGLLLLNILMQLPMPLLTMYLIDHVVAHKKTAILNILCVGLLLFLFIQACASFIQRKLVIKIQNKVVTAIRAEMYKKLINTTLRYFETFKTGDLITRITSDVGKVQGLLADTIITFITDSLSLIVGIVVLMFLHWKLALLSMAIVPLYLVSITFFSGRIRRISVWMQSALSDLTGNLFESFLGIYFVKAFGTEKTETQQTNATLARVEETRIKSEAISAVSNISTSLISNLGRFVLLWYGLSEIINGHLTIGAFLAFNSFLKYIYDPSRSLMELNTTIQQSMASLDRIEQVMNQADQAREIDGTISLPHIKGNVRFDKVDFSYNSERGAVLHDISFEVAPGSMVAIVGPNGAGKTTLINLLLRLYTPNSGTIQIDGVDLPAITNESLRPQFGFVPQDIYLLSQTIAYNIAYGSSGKTGTDIVAASQKAAAHEFISQLPQAYQTVVGERGNRYNFSGGEKQRLSIARAFLKDPRILIFDEATSSVDNESSYFIQKAMRELMRGRTSFVIAHRLSTVVNADLILVMDKGRLVQQGTHHSLMEEGGIYKNLYEKEFLKEDLCN